MRPQSMQDGLGDSKVRDAGPPDTRPCCHLLRLAEEQPSSAWVLGRSGLSDGHRWLEAEDRASGGCYLCSSRWGLKR